MTNQVFTTAAIFCIATLFSGVDASAQQYPDTQYHNAQYQNGQRQIHNTRAPITNPFVALKNRLMGTNPFIRTNYALPTQRPSTGHNCADGRCGLNTACRDCGCDANGENCVCGPNCPPHLNSNNRPQRRDELQAPRPSLRDTRPAVQTPTNFRPVSYSNAVNWEGDIRAAADRSRATGQPMFVQVTASWCGYCQQMKRDTFTNRSVINGINRDFVAVSLDADVNRDLVQQMKIQSLPTTLIVLPNMDVIERLEGFQSASQMQAALNRHMQRAQLDTSARVAVR